ncbi:MAG TPA: hypothetical protein VJ805_04975 [Nitrospiraceae bacterium]|nr:hypothetical protein [Nitrospiraceae bacterium]
MTAIKERRLRIGQYLPVLGGPRPEIGLCPAGVPDLGSVEILKGVYMSGTAAIMPAHMSN